MSARIKKRDIDAHDKYSFTKGEILFFMSPTQNFEKRIQIVYLSFLDWYGKKLKAGKKNCIHL